MNQTCPLCNGKNVIIVFEHLPQFHQAALMRCDDCGHLYSFIREEINVNDLYSDEIYKVVENRNSIFDWIIQREYMGVFNQLDKLQIRKGSLLDFGCGKGQFGGLAEKTGWRVKAVETSPERAAYARNVYGLEVSSDFYSSGSIFNIQFDVLTLFHVLEHLPHPTELMKELVKNNVIKNGIVIIEVPNIESWQYRIAKDNWIHLDVPRHIHHFSPKRLDRFILDLGLRPVKRTYFSFHLGVLGMVDSMLKRIGYKKNIIFELKNKKSKALIFQIAFLLPFAIILELVSSWLGKGGVIRVYSRNPSVV